MRSTEVEYGDFFEDNSSLLNFAPRLGLTWTPWEGRETVVRSGIGILLRPSLGICGQFAKKFGSVLQNGGQPQPGHVRVFPQRAGSARSSLPGPGHGSSGHGLGDGVPLPLDAPAAAAGRLAHASFLRRFAGNNLLRRFEANQFPVPVVQDDGSQLFPKDADPSTRPSVRLPLSIRMRSRFTTRSRFPPTRRSAAAFPCKPAIRSASRWTIPRLGNRPTPASTVWIGLWTGPCRISIFATASCSATSTTAPSEADSAGRIQVSCPRSSATGGWEES